MQLQLTWDLFIIVFFCIVVAYSFIIGRDNTLKVILGTYVSALASDGIGNLFSQYSQASELVHNILKFFQLQATVDVAIVLKVMLFMALVILLVVRGGFAVSATREGSSILRLLLTGFFGFLSAGLILSIILIYVSGISFIAGTAGAAKPLLDQIYQSSLLIKNLVNYHNLWFSIPAFALIITGFMANKFATENE